MIRATRMLLACLAGIVAGGCGTTSAVDNVAISAATQLDSLQSNLSAVVKQHNRYLDESAKFANDEIDMLRAIDIDEFFLRNSDAYVASLRGSSADAVEASLPGFARSTLTNWRARETARQAQRDRLQAMQEAAARKVATDFRKMRELRASLNALGTPRSDREAMKFVAAYLKEVDKELDKLEEDDTDNDD